jgi:hypothetical protein
MRIIFEVAGDKQIDRELLRISGRAQDATPAFESIAGLWIEETRQQFESEGRHASGGWKPLKPETLRAKQRHGLRPEILRAHDLLLHSLTQRRDSNMVLEIGPTGIAYGSKLPYAAAHQNPRSTNPLPRRRPVEFTEATRVETVKRLQRYLLTGEV